mmetsp:Transcript_29728/g.56038  ORF Transcript_29728/g.56038 Transcript_29728/m.56038 type:complete len:84 (+) Transcript_29728:1-252(+)
MMLLQAGADVTLGRTDDGATPLDAATREGHEDVARMLELEMMLHQGDASTPQHQKEPISSSGQDKQSSNLYDTWRSVADGVLA